MVSVERRWFGKMMLYVNPNVLLSLLGIISAPFATPAPAALRCKVRDGTRDQLTVSSLRRRFGRSEVAQMALP